MKKLSTIALLIALTLAAPISTSLAANVAAGASAMLSDKSNYSDVVASVDASGKATAPDLSKVTNKSTINIVKLSTLKGYKAGGLTGSLSTNAKAVAALDTSVAANAALSAKLKAAGFKPTQVVAISSDATGNVSVIVNDGK
jgi:hypothetical protein